MLILRRGSCDGIGQTFFFSSRVSDSARKVEGKKETEVFDFLMSSNTKGPGLFLGLAF